jgi:predicted RNase H-like HicB family nuclease
MPKPTRKPATKPLKEKYVYPVVIERDGDGYFVSCPALDGCYTEGDTYEEAIRNIEDAITLHIEARRDRGEPIPPGEFVGLATVEVTV